jgi:DNA repair protein RecN (Recombination protein N)
MLTSLRIKNLALVEDLALELGGGFTVLTGETGAGKSLLVDALALLVGARGGAESVRTGEERATVEGVVEGDGGVWLAFLLDRGFPDEHPVVLRREVSAAGRSRAWINGAACTLGDLREAGRLWMRLTSQHDHQSLLGEDSHLALVDEASGIKANLGPLAEAVRQADSALKARRRSEADRESRLAWLEEHLAALRGLDPKAGEWAQLREEREPLRHATLLEAAHHECTSALRRALPELENGRKALARALAVWPEAQESVDRLRSVVLELEDLQALSEDRAIQFGKTGAHRLEEVEQRLATFERLSRRHRCEPEELLARFKSFQAEAESLQAGSTSMKRLEKELASAVENYRGAAEALHSLRSDQVPRLEKAVHQRLAKLGMKGARIQARLALGEEAASPVVHHGVAVRVNAQGFSTLSLWIESNPGEGFRPLAKIASGGELSRLMLALLGAGIQFEGAEGSSGLTLVLDEVDAGIGGETALAVGEAIQVLGTRHQVLAVTHLAQVAARADRHGRLTKATEGGRTRSQLEWTEGDARLRELARLLSGHPDRPEALEHARVLLPV